MQLKLRASIVLAVVVGLLAPIRQCDPASADLFLPRPIDQARLLECLGRLMGLEWLCAPSPTQQVRRVDDWTALAAPPKAQIRPCLARDLNQVRKCRSNQTVVGSTGKLYSSYIA